MEYETPPVQSNKSSNKVIMIVAIALVGLILAGVGGYFYGKMVKDQELQVAKQAHETELAQVHADTQAALIAPPKTTTETTCNADELSLAVTDGDATGAGTLSYYLVFTNTGQRTCDLFGYPGVSLVNDNGNMIGTPAGRVANATEVKQTLAPNVKVKSLVTISDEGNVEDGQCKTGATKLRVYPPNDTGYLSATSPVDAWCPEFMVAPVEAN